MTENRQDGPVWLLRVSQAIAALAVAGLLWGAWQLHLASNRINHATLLGAAAARDDLQTMSSMLESGYDPDAKGRKSDSPLFWASQNGNVRALRLLLSYKADVHGEEGTRCLLTAARYGHVDVVQELLKHGADPTGKNLTRVVETPLSAAKKNPNSKSRMRIVSLLRQQGAKK